MWNRIKTAILLASLSGLLMLFGSLIGGANGVTVAFVMSLFINGLMYFFGDKLVLSLYRAQPLQRDTYPEIYALVTELADKTGIPMPKLWLITSPMANAFATGRNPSHASVAFTTGIIELLDRHELRGVIAHELSHIKNRDILISTIAATIATAIAYLASMVRYRAMWGGVSSNNRRNGSGNLIFLLLAGILMPVAATLIQLSISRSREYLADDSGADTSEDPLALASALEKLHTNIKQVHLASTDTLHASTAPLFIVHPFVKKGFISLFSTHPPMAERIKRLRSRVTQAR